MPKGISHPSLPLCLRLHRHLLQTPTPTPRQKARQKILRASVAVVVVDSWVDGDGMLVVVGGDSVWKHWMKARYCLLMPVFVVEFEYLLLSSQLLVLGAFYV